MDSGFLLYIHLLASLWLETAYKFEQCLIVIRCNFYIKKDEVSLVGSRDQLLPSPCLVWLMYNVLYQRSTSHIGLTSHAFPYLICLLEQIIPTWSHKSECPVQEAFKKHTW